jgi:hypothetical protein
MQLLPLLHEPERASWEASAVHIPRPDDDQRLILAILSVKMRGYVIIEVHPDNDAVKLAGYPLGDEALVLLSRRDVSRLYAMRIGETR